MCGPSGAGKTTYIKQQIANTKYKCIHISRDEIRFNLLKDDEDYFAHENEVFEQFVDTINTQILYTDVEVIFVDATHLTEKSRNKTLDCLELDEVELYAINFNVPVETCLEQNENRTGRSYVPRSVIRRMCSQFVPAHENEKYKYTNILWVGDIVND